MSPTHSEMTLNNYTSQINVISSFTIDKKFLRQDFISLENTLNRLKFYEQYNKKNIKKKLEKNIILT